jgi:hypothetical protein
MAHKINRKKEDDFSFDGMMKFYGNVLTKVKDGRDKNLDKKRRDEEITNEPNSIG